jgi:ligand-binding SRPBCC domain-containing protein
MWHKRIQFGRSPTSGGSRMETSQFVPERREIIFKFFSNVFGLQELTPSWVNFQVLSAHPIDIRKGTIIDCRLCLHRVAIRWQSRIEVWEPPCRFVDLQVRGPYRYWHHEHVFEPANGGTICRDIVDYVVRGGWIIDRLFVRSDLKRIFEFRQRKLGQLFFPPGDTGGTGLAKHGRSADALTISRTNSTRSIACF